jgi:FkbM family methyltransferase
MMIKDLEFILKKIIPEKYLLKKRLKRAIEKNYEKELEVINQFADKSKDALDIGVYRGVYSYKLSQNYNLVHSFEPNPLLYPHLKRNLKKIINNIKLYNLALSDKNGETRLKLPIRNNSIFSTNIEELYQLGAASIHPENKFEKFKEVVVKMKKLDDLKIENKIGFIKIDVEGHELEVIKGSSKIISENMPILLVEIEKRHTNKPVLESINYIKNMGYDCFFVKNKKLISVENLENNDSENNYYFLPKKIKLDL